MCSLKAVDASLFRTAIPSLVRATLDLLIVIYLLGSLAPNLKIKCGGSIPKAIRLLCSIIETHPRSTGYTNHLRSGEYFGKPFDFQFYYWF